MTNLSKTLSTITIAANRIVNSSLFRASGIYTFALVLNSGIPFLLLPILTRYLTPADYGIVSMFTLLVSIFNVFTGLSVHGAINRVYFDKNINFKEYVFNCIIILIISSSITFIMGLLFLDFISNVSSVTRNWIPLAVVISFFQFIIFSVLSIYQARMWAKKYSFIMLSQSLINVFFTIVLVVFLNLKWQGRIIAQSLTIIIVGFFGVYLLKNWINMRINLNYIMHALKFGIPLIPHTIGGMLMVLTDRFIITNLLGVEKTGIYTAGLQIGSIITLLADAFNKAYAPWLFGKLESANYGLLVKIVRFTYVYFILIIFFALLIGALAPYIVSILLGKSFQDSAAVILWITIGGAFTGMYFMVVNYIYYVHKTYLLAFTTFVTGLLNIFLTYFLVKINGLIGAAHSFALINFITFIAVWILSMKVYNMPWFKWKISNSLRR